MATLHIWILLKCNLNIYIYIFYKLELHCIYSEQYKIPCNIQFTNRMNMIAWDLQTRNKAIPNG